MTDLVRRAELFAREQHIRQFRKGYAHEPYIAQVEEVAELACIWAALTPPWRLRDCTAQLRLLTSRYIVSISIAISIIVH